MRPWSIWFLFGSLILFCQQTSTIHLCSCDIVLLTSWAGQAHAGLGDLDVLFCLPKTFSSLLCLACSSHFRLSFKTLPHTLQCKHLCNYFTNVFLMFWMLQKVKTASSFATSQTSVQYYKFRGSSHPLFIPFPFPPSPCRAALTTLQAGLELTVFPRLASNLLSQLSFPSARSVSLHQAGPQLLRTHVIKFGWSISRFSSLPYIA